ncbi:MAG TPA: peptidoglycan recognition family protein [Planctomycetota bacterium]|nr:peptidoglycan recognition family protein [Planctomycetota bacterium]
MRLVVEFLAGIFSGLLSRTSQSCPRPRAGARPQPASASASITEVVSRMVLLLICIGIGAVAVLGVSRPRSREEAAPEIPSPHFSTPSPTNNLDEILATDPAAPSRAWRYVVIHHSASTRGSAQSFDQYHREVRRWQGLGYHFVIGNGADQGDGTIIAGPRWYAQEAGAHANSSAYNEHGIGVCLVGNFEESPPTPAQMIALQQLVQRLCDRFQIGVGNVVGHNQIRRGGATACPGKLFPFSELRSALR